MCVCSITIIPSGQGASISSALTNCLKALDRFPDLKHQLTPMSTQLEGPLDRVLEALKAMHLAGFESGAARVYTTISIDDRRDKELSLAGKVASLQTKLKS